MNYLGQLCRVAVSIAIEPHKYKVCNGCEVIAYANTKICKCGGYNFSDNVREHLLKTLEDCPILRDECIKMIEEYEENTKN